MPATALGLALGAAILHASWNVLLRGSEDVEARTAVALALSVILFAPAAVATWSASRAIVPYVVASAALEGVYFSLLVAAYKRRDLSVVYPVARGSAPVLVLLGSAVVLGRAVSPGEAVGVCLVAAGVALVRGLRSRAGGIAVGLAIGCAIAAYTLVDKDGIRHAGAIPYLELVLAPVALAALVAAGARRGIPALRAELRFPTLAAAAGSFGAYVLILVALRLATAPAVAAVRETSVVFGAGLAALVLRERVSAERLAGAAAVACGVALVALS